MDSNSKFRVWQIQLFQLRVTAEWKTPPFFLNQLKKKGGKKTIACEPEYLRLGGVCDSYALLGPLPKRFSQRESWAKQRQLGLPTDLQTRFSCKVPANWSSKHFPGDESNRPRVILQQNLDAG